MELAVVVVSSACLCITEAMTYCVRVCVWVCVCVYVCMCVYQLSKVTAGLGCLIPVQLNRYVTL